MVFYCALGNGTWVLTCLSPGPFNALGMWGQVTSSVPASVSSAEWTHFHHCEKMEVQVNLSNSVCLGNRLFLPEVFCLCPLIQVGKRGSPCANCNLV